MSGTLRNPSVWSYDAAAAFLSFPLAMLLRVGAAAPAWGVSFLVQNAALFAVVWLGVTAAAPIHRSRWRYTSLPDVLAVARTALAAELVFVPLAFFVSRLATMPRSLFVLQLAVLVTLLVLPRVLLRYFREVTVGVAHVGKPVVLVGGGPEVDLFLRAAAESPRWRVVGLMAGGGVGTSIRGVPVAGDVDADLIDVLGGLSERPEWLVVSPSLPASSVRALFSAGASEGLQMGRLPTMTEIRGSEVPDVRPFALEDLLHRPTATLDRDAIRRFVAGRRCLVTGAGGSIGSELVRQVAACGPSLLMLVDHSEYNLYAIDLELRERAPDVVRMSRICNVRDRARLDAVFAECQPEVVFHAAALKHVPMVEHNPSEGVLTNVGGSRNVADMAVRHSASAMVMISTDKAVHPTNVMGASKRLAECYVSALDLLGGPTRFVTVRFGNVLGSSGSVVPLFERQLRRGGPLTVTHPEIERYFMTISEAVQLVLQASTLSLGSEGKLFVLDMGSPVKIAELARQMIELSGRDDVDIVFTGLRPGEKLTEEPLHLAEHVLPTPVSGIFLASPRTVDHTLLCRGIDALLSLAAAQRDDAVVARLGALVPEFDRYVPPSVAGGSV